MMGRKEIKKHKKRKRIKKVLISFLILFFVAASAGVYFVYQTLQAASESYNDLDGRDKSDKRDEEVSVSKDPISILLMGIEDYETGGENGRTDTLMVVTYDPKSQTAKMLSIPRDTLVDFVGMDRRDKINHAHVFGGKEMTIHTVEEFLDIPIDYFAAVNFDAFIEVVDIFDGVTVNVPFDFEQKTMAPNSYYVEFKEGEQHVNGEEALAFVRMRKQDPRGDIGRGERQQEVIKALSEKAMDVKNVTKIDDLTDVVAKHVETNMKVSEGLVMFKNLTDFGRDNLESINLETYPQRIDNTSYQIADEQSLLEAQQALKEHLKLDNENENEEVTEDQN